MDRTARFARGDLRRRAVALFEQQLWCWGRDVARPQGNVFLALGMCRYPPPDPACECTAYTARVAGDGVVWLWGFGLLYWRPDVGGVFVRRFGFEPLLARLPICPLHSPDGLAPLVARPTSAGQHATAATAVRAAAGWVAGYEHWIAETYGTAYRETTLAARSRSPAVPAADMARSWEHLAKKGRRLTAAPLPPPAGAKSLLLAPLFQQARNR